MLSLLCAAALPAQEGGRMGIAKSSFEERPALLVANGKLEATVLLQGGAMAALRLSDDPGRLSPLWDPARMARESGRKNPFNSATGHFICVDGFGPVSPEEQAAGLPGHGELHLQTVDVLDSRYEGGVTVLKMGAKLPMLQETYTRTLRMADGENVIHVESELTSLLGFDRPVCWAEHATIGAPFLEPGVTVVDMPAARARTRPHEPEKALLPHRLPSAKDFTWPLAPGISGESIDLRAAPANPNSGDHTTCLMDPARKLVWVTALHPGRRLVLGYLFRREDFPWVQNWEYYPADGTLARGMEFSTMPFDVPRREAIQLNSMFDAPTYRWLPARSKIGSRFL